MTKIKSLREHAKKDLLKKLNKYGKCALVKCPGFGKTYMLAGIAEYYDKVLYIYPTKIIADTLKKHASKNTDITYMTYSKLTRMADTINTYIKDFDLIIFDECHRMGAAKAFPVIEDMFKHTDKHFIGATATPERMDNVDIMEHFFNNICTEKYTLHEAIEDKVIKKPIYTYCSYNIKQDIDDAVKDNEELTGKMIELSNLFNMPSIIQRVTSQYVKDTSYMRYIAFFSTIESLYKHEKEVKSWFKKAFPGYKINTIPVTSEPRNTGIDNIQELKVTKNKIDLILAVDMLNMGYHIPELTGIILYRATQSNTIFIQQLGRALNDTESKLVFDVVDNLHTAPIYVNRYSGTKSNKKTWWKEPDVFFEDDLEATGEAATYKEMVKRINYSAKKENILQLIESHRARWEELNPTPYPATPDELLSRQTEMPPVTAYADAIGIPVIDFVQAVYNKDIITA